MVWYWSSTRSSQAIDAAAEGFDVVVLDVREPGEFSGYLGHYHADPRLDRAKCDEVYLSWAERSCVDPSVASKVLVAG